MSSLININQTHLVQNGFNNRFEYKFGNSSLNFSNAEIAVSSIVMFNSHFNIDQTAYSNSKFGLLIFDPSNNDVPAIENIQLPDGYWSYNDINLFLQGEMKRLGAYLIDSDGNERYYIRISENATRYACQIDFAVVPSSLPSGWSLPPSGYYSNGLPTVAYTLSLRLFPNSEFNKVIGFSLEHDNSDTVLPKSGSPVNPQSILSDIPPQINPVNSYLVRCNLISNIFSNPGDILTTMTTRGVDIGQLIYHEPSELIWVDVANGSYSSLIIEFNDQFSRFIRFRDPNIQINLIIRQKKLV